MNLPHGTLLHYAKEVLSYDEERVEVYCELPPNPSLALFIEVAAQSASAFHLENKEDVKMGFVSMVQDLKMFEVLDEQSYIFVVNKDVEIGNYKKMIFKAYAQSDKRLMVSGRLTLVIAV